MPKHILGPTPFGITISDAEGCYLYGSSGEKYIDFLGGWCVCTAGWKNPRILKAIQEKSPAYYLPPTIFHNAWDNFAEKLLATFRPEINKLFRVTSGSEAVEFALKLARAATGKKTIISFGEVYHGHTFGAASIGAAMSEAMQPGIGEVVRLNLPNEYKNKHGLTGSDLSTAVLKEIEDVYKLGNTAAFISEPIFTNAGMIVPPEDFYPRLEELCKKYGVLLIMDEVASGFGRTGKIYGYEHWGIEPDIVTLGKGLTGGYATAGAVVCTEAVAEKSHLIPRYSTFGWNLNDLPAMEENFNIFMEEKLWENADTVGKFLLNELKSLEELPKVGQVRGIGMVFSIEFVNNKTTKESAGDLAEQIMKEGFKAGIVTETARADILFFSPPLVMDEKIALEGAAILKQLITKYAT